MGSCAVVEHCSYDTIHATIGAITLRLEASAIAPLAATIHEQRVR